MEEVPSRSFLVFRTFPDTWELPGEYSNVLEKHLCSIPTELILPWPVNICPRNIGDEICFSSMLTPYADFVVEKFEYIYSRKKGVTQWVRLRPTEDGMDFNLNTLLHAADEGFLFESEVPISRVLYDAGLRHTAVG